MEQKNRTAVSVIGIGVMGTAIATRLMACGHPVTVFNRSRTSVENMVARGAAPAENAAQACRASTFIITCLNSAEIVRSAVFGPGGIAEAADSTRLLIDMSSIDPRATRTMADELAAKTGMHWVDAPLSGGAPRALEGQLTVMAGGAPEDIMRAKEVMDTLCSNFTHMGPSGAGQTTKLVNQVLCAIGYQAVAEAVRLAEAGGVNAARLSQALSGGRADSRILQEYGTKMAMRDYSLTGRIDNMMKDLEGVQALAGSQRVPLPITSAVAELHRLLVAAGLGGEDTAAIMKQFSGFRG